MPALLMACGSADAGNLKQMASTAPEPSTSPSFLVDDVRIARVPDSVSVHWDLTYDARWIGSEVPGAIRCRWRIVNRDGEVVQVGVVDLTEPWAEDAVAGTVYPDEVPGVPETGSVTC